jgi:hypothetical protein
LSLQKLLDLWLLLLLLLNMLGVYIGFSGAGVKVTTVY